MFNSEKGRIGGRVADRRSDRRRDRSRCGQREPRRNVHNFVDLGTGKLMFDSQGNAWVADNFMVGAQNQDAFDDFDGKINKMQGIIAAPSGDIWAIDTMNSQVVHFPKGDTSKGEILCHNPSWDPLANHASS